MKEIALVAIFASTWAMVAMLNQLLTGRGVTIWTIFAIYAVAASTLLVEATNCGVSV